MIQYAILSIYFTFQHSIIYPILKSIKLKSFGVNYTLVVYFVYFLLQNVNSFELVSKLFLEYFKICVNILTKTIINNNIKKIDPLMYTQ